jgi:hypothetical protein
MARPRIADDFAAIRERMEELRRERSRWSGEPSDENGPPARSRPVPAGKPELRLLVRQRGRLIR